MVIKAILTILQLNIGKGTSHNIAAKENILNLL